MHKTISRFILSIIFAGGVFSAPAAYAQCSSPTSIEGGINYDATADTLNVCDGTNWLLVGPGGGSSLWTNLTGGRIHYGTSSANQVGVGTNNPGYTLDVNGDINLPVGSTIRAGGNEMMRMIAPNDASGVHAIVVGTNSAHTNLGAGTGFNQWEAPGVYIGHNAGNNIDSTGGGSQGHVFIGTAAGQNVTTNTFNTLIGANAGDGNTVAFSATVLGAGAGRNPGQNTVYVGAGAGGNDTLTLGGFNTVVGSEAGQDTTGNWNTFIGMQSGREQRGASNVALGYQALHGVDTTSTADNNIAIGYRAMDAVTTSAQNVAIGSDAASALIDGGGANVFIGQSAGSGANTNSAYRNVVIGAFAGNVAGLGFQNTFLGERAGQNVTGNNNTFIGRSAGQDVATGNDNVVLGRQPESGQTFTAGTNNILLGANVDTPTATSNDYLNIGNLIYGDLANSEVFLDAPAAAPADGDLTNGQVTFWIDATNDEIELKARDSAGDIINATVGSGGGGGANELDDLTDAYTDYTTDNNVAIGQNAGAALASGGTSNTFVGQNAGDSLTTGDENVAIGRNAMQAATVMGYSVAIGYNAAGNWTGTSEYESLLAIGAGAAAEQSGGFGNIAIGNSAMNLGGNNRNVVIGNDAGYNGINEENTVVGQNAMNRTAGSYNVMIGQEAGIGQASASVDQNVIIGQDAARNINTGANDNTIIGFNTAGTLTTGASNIIIGSGVDVSAATVSNELNIGNAITGTLDATSPYTASDITIAGDLTITGTCTGCGGGGGGSLDALSDAATDYTDNNLFIGQNAGSSIASGGLRNLAIGQDAGDAITTGDGNITIGYNAGSDITTNVDIIAIGDGAGLDVGNQTVAIGKQAGYQTDAGNSVIIGPFAGFSPTVGDGSIAIGYSALYGGGNNTVSIGAESGNGVYNTSNPVESIFLGTRAAQNITSGDRNIFIGYQVGDVTTTGADNIVIGHNIDPSAAGASNELNIGGTLYGDLSNDLIGIGQVPATGVELDVLGDIEYTGTITDVSDRRLKDNIKPLSKHGSLIEKIDAIDTYSFTMKDDEDGKTEFGVIAQEIEKIFPELVRTADDEMGTKSVNYVGLIAPMIEATKELKSENAALKAEINDIKQDIAGMKLHTGYDIEKANIQTVAMMLLMMIFGGACVMITTHARRNQS